MIFIWCQKGATSWDWQIGRVWLCIRYPRFWRTSGFGFIQITNKDGSAREDRKRG